MIAGWITVGEVPVLVVLDSLDAPCVVSVLWIARLQWRTAMKGAWYPDRGEVEVFEHDVALPAFTWNARLSRYLRGRRARDGAGMARLTEAVSVSPEAL